MTSTQKNPIPEPPDANASPEELAAYYEQYSPQELIEAGYMKVLPKDDPGTARRRELAKSALKKKRAQLNIVLDEKERAELEAYARAVHIPVSTIAKSWILRALNLEKTRISETRI